MNVELTNKEFRLLLDMVYIGNWVLNSTREDDCFKEYNDLESKLFSLCRNTRFSSLVQEIGGEVFPSQAYEEGGIHDAIEYYEDNIFFEMLAEELVRRDMSYPDALGENYEEFLTRMDEYMEEFEKSGLDHLVLEENS